MEQQLDNEISLKELIEKLVSIWKYLLSKWLIVGMLGVIGAGIGFFIAWSKPIKYTARISFVVEEGKSNIGGLASLAGQLGFDIGGTTNSSLFVGDNIFIFLKSESLIRETLLSKFDDTISLTIADKYSEISGFKKRWLENNQIGAIDFSSYINQSYSRKYDSLLHTLFLNIYEDIRVAKIDKKASFVEVKVSTKDELVSKVFAEKLVKNGVERYIQSKVKTKAANVALLQKRADSLGYLLNRNTYLAADAQQQLVDINPALRTAPVQSEISTRDKMMIATIFAEVVKNLELAKFTLNQETPIIQIVDSVRPPLIKENNSPLISIFLGTFSFVVLTIIFLLIKRWLQFNISNN